LRSSAGWSRQAAPTGNPKKYRATMTTPFNVRPESWARLSALLDEAFDLDPAARAKLLAQTSTEDPELGAELARLMPSMNQHAGSHLPNAAPFTSLLNLALVSTASDKTGATFGAWTLTEKIGQGGMGEVWRAVRSDGLFQGTAAIKILRSDSPADKLAARFARERAVLARLNHPNIARLLDAGVANEQAFIVLELVQGSPLLDFAAASAPTVADRVRLIRDLARAVEHAHSQLVLHRDLKPSNVLVTENGSAKLLDFGIAAALDEATQNETTPNLTLLTGRGLTLEYAAPEQILGEPTVAASDVYSLGAMLFHLLTGQRPFAGNANRAALEFAAVHTEAPRASGAVRLPETDDAFRLPPPGGEGGGEGVAIPNLTGYAESLSPERGATSMLRLPPSGREQNGSDQIAPPNDPAKLRGDLDTIIAKTLRKSPAERYATATAFAADLDAWLAQTPISIRAEDRSYRSKLWLKRNWKLATLGATAALAVTTGLGVSLWQRSVAIAHAAVAQDEAARATKVADYLGELIESASPDKHGGNWPSVLTLLEQSETSLAAQFKDDPKTHAILLKRMLDSNDALNRDSVALAQAERLALLLASISPPDVTALLENRQQQGWLLKRLNRDAEALAMDETSLPLFAAHFGAQSDEYASLLIGVGNRLSRLSRYAEGMAKYAEGYGIIEKLHPNSVRFRLERGNDEATLLLRQGNLRAAFKTLQAGENDFAALAALGGQRVRDALIMRGNLEAIRVRLSQHEGTEARLRVIAAEGERLLGKDNQITAKAIDSLATMAWDSGKFDESLSHRTWLLESIKRRAGAEPGLIIEATLGLVSARLSLARIEPNAARDTLQTVVAQTLKSLPLGSRNRTVLLASAATCAANIGAIEIADDAIAQARANFAATRADDIELLATINHAAAHLAARKGDYAGAAQWLDERFRVISKFSEGDTARHTTLWLQRALFEIEFDAVAAGKSLAESRAVDARAGVTTAQFKALFAYIDARISGNAASVLEAQAAVDRAYLRAPNRAPKTPWRTPFLSIL
jgi:eukaryotic-like serine/threonine-protein kinase